MDRKLIMNDFDGNLKNFEGIVKFSPSITSSVSAIARLRIFEDSGKSFMLLDERLSIITVDKELRKLLVSCGHNPDHSDFSLEKVSTKLFNAIKLIEMSKGRIEARSKPTKSKSGLAICLDSFFSETFEKNKKKGMSIRLEKESALFQRLGVFELSLKLEHCVLFGRNLVRIKVFRIRKSLHKKAYESAISASMSHVEYSHDYLIEDESAEHLNQGSSSLDMQSRPQNRFGRQDTQRKADNGSSESNLMVDLAFLSAHKFDTIISAVVSLIENFIDNQKENHSLNNSKLPAANLFGGMISNYMNDVFGAETEEVQEAIKILRSYSIVRSTAVVSNQDSMSFLSPFQRGRLLTSQNTLIDNATAHEFLPAKPENPSLQVPNQIVQSTSAIKASVTGPLQIESKVSGKKQAQLLKNSKPAIKFSSKYAKPEDTVVGKPHHNIVLSQQQEVA